MSASSIGTIGITAASVGNYNRPDEGVVYMNQTICKNGTFRPDGVCACTGTLDQQGNRVIAPFSSTSSSMPLNSPTMLSVTDDLILDPGRAKATGGN